MPLEKPGRFLLEIFDDEAVLFDTLSGDTHHLGQIALARLQGMTPEQIKANFAAGDDGEELPAVLKAVDDQLRAWGLII
jgi:hypothetical protein